MKSATIPLILPSCLLLASSLLSNLSSEDIDFIFAFTASSFPDSSAFFRLSSFRDWLCWFISASSVAILSLRVCFCASISPICPSISSTRLVPSAISRCASASFALRSPISPFMLFSSASSLASSSLAKPISFSSCASRCLS